MKEVEDIENIKIRTRTQLKELDEYVRDKLSQLQAKIKTRENDEIKIK